MARKDILVIENLAAFEKLINRDHRPDDIKMMVMPGTLEDKHKDVDPEKGIPAHQRKLTAFGKTINLWLILGLAISGFADFIHFTKISDYTQLRIKN